MKVKPKTKADKKLVRHPDDDIPSADDITITVSSGNPDLDARKAEVIRKTKKEIIKAEWGAAFSIICVTIISGLLPWLVFDKPWLVERWIGLQIWLICLSIWFCLFYTSGTTKTVAAYNYAANQKIIELEEEYRKK